MWLHAEKFKMKEASLIISCVCTVVMSVRMCCVASNCKGESILQIYLEAKTRKFDMITIFQYISYPSRSVEITIHFYVICHFESVICKRVLSVPLSHIDLNKLSLNVTIIENLFLLYKLSVPCCLKFDMQHDI